MNDDQLIAMIQLGGGKAQKAMTVIYNQNREELAKHIHFRTGCPESDIEDIVHETFIKIFRYVLDPEVHIRRSLTALLKTSAVNLVIDRFRQSGSVVDSVSLEESEVVRYIEDPSLPDPCEFLIRRVVHECYQNAFKLFCEENPDRGDVLIKQKVDGMSTRQLAEQLGKSISNTTTYISECRKKLGQYKERVCSEVMNTEFS
ncbi:MAG: RNA polymerase sigma factor (sigma-70 family) [Planctomycetota bacterium]|jgi:RNA polymerase sigma factor (sigma-70 family)